LSEVRGQAHKASTWEILLLGLVLAGGAALRFYGLTWDGGQWLHPDERQVYFAVLALDWPHTLAEALSPESPLNPRFFAYGSLPLYLLKLVAGLLAPLSSALRDPDNLHLVGRPLAAVADLGTVYLTYRLARTILPPPRRGQGLNRGALLAAALVSVAVLHVQLAHFYTADPLLTFLVMLTLNLAVDVSRGGSKRRQAALGVALGLTLATKVSAAPLVLVIPVAYAISVPDSRSRWPTVIRRTALTLLIAVAVFFLVQPYALIDWRTFLDHTLRESQIAWGRLDVPYTRQYAGTLPYVYSMWQTAFWGVGLPLGLVAWIALAVLLVRWLRQGSRADTMLLAWTGPYLAITGLLYTRYLRYMLPLVPILCILAVQLASGLKGRRQSVVGRWGLGIGYWVVAIGSLVYVLVFAGIYSGPHPWISVSEWIYREVSAGSILAVEHWDTALPLPLDVGGKTRHIEEYDVRVLPLYDEPDDDAKWERVALDLAESDFLIIASRRLYGSIPRLQERYPVTTRYYEMLITGDLGFELAGEFSQEPVWLNPRLPPLPDPAPALLWPDESFVVYDHPRTLVFRNAEHLPAGVLLRRLTSGIR
jgi:hypothetical protein